MDEGGGAGDAGEVAVGEEVDLLARLDQPVEEGQVVGAEVRRHAAGEVWPGEESPVLLPPRVPGVASAVPVVVAEVVGLPRVGRKDDEHVILADSVWPDDERRKAHPAVGRLETG